ncbi:hypothetical protein GO009_17195 [Muricauda sp. TY007]|nr:hypothetical protein [Muricauda sp. TY007]
MKDTVLNTLRIKDVAKKRKFTHEEFTEWMASLRKKTSLLEERLNGSYFQPIKDGAGTVYYLVKEEDLL